MLVPLYRGFLTMTQTITETPEANGTAKPMCPSPEKITDPIVSFRGVSKSFGSLRVLHDVDLDFRRGDCTVVLGPSGTGKSVMLKHIVGLLKPDEGEVFFDGERVDTMKERQLVEVRKQIGFLFQMGALFDSMNVGQNVEYPLIEHSNLKAGERSERVDRVLRMVCLSGIQNKMPAQLSGGQRKRIALARAIVLGPKLVLYDEPTTGLDPIRSDVINELIITLNKSMGISSIVVTHDMNSANKIADRMLLLYDGHVICDGTPDEFHRSENELVRRFIQGQAAPEELRGIRDGFIEAEGTIGPDVTKPVEPISNKKTPITKVFRDKL